MRTQNARRSVSAVVVSALALGLGACGAVDDDPDLVAGKKAFVEKCGSCHQLDRAGTKGLVGPDLDEAFRQSLTDGLGRGGVRGIVAEQIEYPARLDEGERGKGEVVMPANLVTGDAVDDVAAYVAEVSARGGEDTGLLAEAVKAAGSGKPIAAKDGKLVIPADPGGQLAYTSAMATAPVGAIEIESPNESSVPHNIVIDGFGEGEVVQDGGVSRIAGDVEAGKTYVYFCSVQGHREAGMEGELTVAK